jgi:hypothetical protein
VEKSRFTIEQLHAAHEFRFVEDRNDRLSVCEVATTLYHALPDVEDYSIMQNILDDYINSGDGYWADELVEIFEFTIWEGKV